MSAEDLTPAGDAVTGTTTNLKDEAAQTVQAAQTTPLENTETWIVRIDGVEHTVKADTPEGQIRETLAMTYPGARDAAISHDSVIVDGQRYKVLVFTKRAGTKGMRADELRELLILVPPVPLSALTRAGTFHPGLRGHLAFDELLMLETDAEGYLVTMNLEESQLCAQLSSLPPAVVVVTVGA